MSFVQTSGATIHWEMEGSGTPVLLIMGHLYSTRMWYPLVPALSQSHSVIRFDNRGTGESDTTSGVSMKTLVADALAVLDAAKVGAAHVVGVSMGGGIALELAMSHPSKVLSLALGCTMLKTEVLRPSLWQRLPYFLPASLVKSRLLKQDYGSAAPSDRVARDREVLAGERFTMKGVRQQAQAIVKYAASPEAARQLKMPVLVMHGEEDRIIDVANGIALSKAIPHSTLKIFPGAAHNFNVAAGDEATRTYMDFIDGVDQDLKAEQSGDVLVQRWA